MALLTKKVCCRTEAKEIDVQNLYLCKKQVRTPQDYFQNAFWSPHQEQTYESAKKFLTFPDELGSLQCASEIDSLMGGAENGASPSVCEQPSVRPA